MGGCCGAASDDLDDFPEEVPPRGRGTRLPSNHDAFTSEMAGRATTQKSSTKKKQRESFTTLGGSSDTASLTHGCTTTTRTTTAATSHPGCTPATSVVVVAESTQPGFDGPLHPHFSPTDSGCQRAGVGQLPPPLVPAAGRAMHDGADALLSDVFHISESSVSSSSCIADHDALSASMVEVSQATQSYRHHDRTHSEIDATSEWGETSMDRTYRHRRSRSRLADRSRLQHLVSSEAEVRASLMLMYGLQHQRVLLRCVKEQFIEQRVSMLREHQQERTVSCVGWLLAKERAARAGIAREWWTERALLARRQGVATTTAAEAASETREAVKREDSVAPTTSHNGREEALSSSEGTVEDDGTDVRSPSVRFAALHPPHESSSSAVDVSPQKAAAAFAALTLSPPSQVPSCGAGQRVSSAQQALRDKIARSRRQSGETMDAL